MKTTLSPPWPASCLNFGLNLILEYLKRCSDIPFNIWIFCGRWCAHNTDDLRSFNTTSPPEHPRGSQELRSALMSQWDGLPGIRAPNWSQCRFAIFHWMLYLRWFRIECRFVGSILSSSASFAYNIINKPINIIFVWGLATRDQK